MKGKQSLMEEEVPRYRKKSKSHSPAKSKHKHDYQPCVFAFNSPAYTNINGFMVQQERKREVNGTYCTICGKMGDFRWESLFYQKNLTEDDLRELNPETRTVPTFWVDDEYGQKFIALDKYSQFYAEPE